MDVQVTGARRAGAYINRMLDRLVVAYKATTGDALDELEKEASAYPPESEANRPAHGSYGPFYIRGEGNAYMSQSGQVRVYPTSEQLGDSWVRRIIARAQGILGTVGPRTAYANFVVGNQQAPYHARRQWPTLAGTVKAKFKTVVGMFVATTVRVVKRG